MSVLIDSSVTIYEVIQNIKDGKYVMPAFQRQYVWSMEQIEKLWDSILLDYPIATFLFWHHENQQQQNRKSTSSKQPFYIFHYSPPYNSSHSSNVNRGVCHVSS